MKKTIGLLLIGVSLCVLLVGCGVICEWLLGPFNLKYDWPSFTIFIAVILFLCFILWSFGLSLFDNRPMEQVAKETFEKVRDTILSFLAGLFGCCGCLLVLGLATGICSWLGATGIIIVLLVLILLKK